MVKMGSEKGGQFSGQEMEIQWEAVKVFANKHRFSATCKSSHAQSCRLHPLFPFRSLTRSIQIQIFNIAL